VLDIGSGIGNLAIELHDYLHGGDDSLRPTLMTGLPACSSAQF
jgi:hypothetical protein